MALFIPPLIYILAALNFYIYNKPFLGPLTRLVLRNNPAPETGGGKYRDPVWVEIPQGRMKGSQEISRIGAQYYWFRGIPYAKPPVGELRYEPPEPHEGWNDTVLDATTYGSECLQVNFFTRRIVGSENCLFLNVATRKLPESSDKREDRYPVLFFIHGGLFMFGQANPFGPKYFMDEKVVLVSLNYRLNSFGFLNTGDGVVQGNMGLKDQVEGLRWVQQNIQYFNGDSNRVILLGESAGAASVHLLTLSPLTRGLFSGAISLSGTAMAPWAHVPNPAEQSKEYGMGLGCPTNNGSETMVACLKSLDAQTVANYHHGAIIAASQGKSTLFGPTVDSGSENLFLPASPVELMRSGQVSDRPWVTGVNSGDGLVYLIAPMRNETMRRYINSHWKYLAPKVFTYTDHPDKDQVSKDVVEYYLGNQELSHDNILQANNLFSDRGFFQDSHDAAVMQSRAGAPTYAFYYTYEGVFNGGNMLFTRAKLPLPSDYQYIFGSGKVWLKSMLSNERQPAQFGICHGREVLPGDADFEFSRMLVKLWVSFAETGVPDTSSAGVKWEPLSVPNGNATVIRRNDMPLQRLLLDEKLEIINEPFYERMQFWPNHSISYLPPEEE